LVLALILGAPGIGVGALCGVLAAPRRRVAGAVIGAVVGWIAGLAAFFAWAESRASLGHDFGQALWIGFVHALPGLVVGAMLGAWPRKGARISGAVWGGLAGAGLALAGWWVVGGALR
jgi:hypothetical protein